MACPVCGKEKGCAAYLRVSTQDQARKGFSLPEQREQVLQKAEALGFCRQCVTVFEDAHTGAEMERPGWDQLREGVRAGRFGTVICLCPDRLGRNTVGMLLAYEELKAWGARVEYVQLQVDETTPEGHLFLQISAVFSDYERRKIVSRIVAGKERKVKETGRLPHRVRLFGYRFNPETDLLEVDPQEKEVVRQIFRWAAYGDADGGGGGGPDGGGPLSVGDICRRLNSLGIPRADGKGPWFPATVARMLRRDVYYRGVFTTHRWEDKARTRPRPPERRYAITVEPLVDEGTWRAANRQLQLRRPARRGKAAFLLRGLARCGRCGRRLYTSSSRPRGRLFRYYRCPGEGRGPSGTGEGAGVVGSGEAAQQAPPCAGGYWNADAVEEAVWQALAPVLWEAAPAALSLLARGTEPLPRFLQGQKSRLLAQLEALEQKRLRMLDLYLGGQIGKEEMEGLRGRYGEEAAQIRARLRELESHLKGEAPVHAEARPNGEARFNAEAQADAGTSPGAAGGGGGVLSSPGEEALDRVRSLLQAGPHDVRQRAVADFIQGVQCFADGRLLIEGYFPPEVLPGPGSRPVDPH